MLLDILFHTHSPANSTDCIGILPFLGKQEKRIDIVGYKSFDFAISRTISWKNIVSYRGSKPSY
jgi:hypothetical protein